MRQLKLGKNKKVNFIRIPKNASTSLYNFFGVTNTIRDDYLTCPESVYKNIFAPSHCTFDTAIDCLGNEILNLPTLAVARNPYDRAVSFYHFSKKYSIFSIYNKPELSFVDFLEEFSNQNDDFFHAWPQMKFFKNHQVDVIKFENIEADLWNFLKKNNIDVFYKNAKRRLKKENQTIHENDKKYYCSRSKKIVKEMWGEDICFFSYKF